MTFVVPGKTNEQCQNAHVQEFCAKTNYNKNINSSPYFFPVYVYIIYKNVPYVQ